MGMGFTISLKLGLLRRRMKMSEIKYPNDKFSVRDQELWDKCVGNNQDCPYGSAINAYAAKWASLMEADMKEGKKIKDIAEATSRATDTEGITGFMYGAAVSTLAGVWEHGEELRKWHNVKTQIHDEGEKANDKGTVLNPTLMTIRSPD
jgi:hypothetical protein